MIRKNVPDYFFSKIKFQMQKRKLVPRWGIFSCCGFKCQIWTVWIRDIFSFPIIVHMRVKTYLSYSINFWFKEWICFWFPPFHSINSILSHSGLDLVHSVFAFIQLHLVLFFVHNMGIYPERNKYCQLFWLCDCILQAFSIISRFVIESVILSGGLDASPWAWIKVACVFAL